MGECDILKAINKGLMLKYWEMYSVKMFSDFIDSVREIERRDSARAHACERLGAEEIPEITVDDFMIICWDVR